MGMGKGFSCDSLVMFVRESPSPSLHFVKRMPTGPMTLHQRLAVLAALTASARAFIPAVPPAADAMSLLRPRAAPWASRCSPSALANRPSVALAARVDRSRLTPEQLETLEVIEAELKTIFQKYDRNRDGHLTMEEYNTWCMENNRSSRLFTGELRFQTFCKTIGSDPSKGLSIDGLVDLYAKPTQQGRAYSALAAATLPLWGALLACILLSIPYYLPSCTEYCRQLPWQ